MTCFSAVESKVTQETITKIEIKITFHSSLNSYHWIMDHNARLFLHVNQLNMNAVCYKYSTDRFKIMFSAVGLKVTPETITKVEIKITFYSHSSLIHFPGLSYAQSPSSVNWL